jgi:hypothetical protein
MTCTKTNVQHSDLLLRRRAMRTILCAALLALATTAAEAVRFNNTRSGT